jgi:hypothetical protein
VLRLLWIPVAGTLAALVVILVVHEPRPEALEPGAAPDGFDVEISPIAPISDPVLDVSLLEDGRCRAEFEWDGRTGVVLAPDAMLDRLFPPEGEPRCAVRLLASSPAVTETMLQQTAAAFRRRCDVTIETHAGKQED